MPDGLPAGDSAEELWEDAPCGYLTTTTDGHVSRVNRTFLRWTGLERDAVVGTRFADLLTSGGRIFYETHLAPMLELQGHVRELALDVQCDGARLPVLLNAAVHEDEVRMVVLDASERRSYEQELVAARRAERRARERTEALQTLTAALLGADTPLAVGRAAGRALAPALGVRGMALEVGGELVWQEGDPAGETHVLHSRGETIGALRLALTGPPADDDAALLAAGIAQVAQALDRALLHAATRAAAERAALLAAMGRELSELRSVADRADRLVELLVPALADAAVVDLPSDGQAGSVFAVAGVPPPEAMSAAALRPGSIEPGLAALALRGRGRPLGTLVLVRGRGRAFAADDHAHLRAVADRAGLALDNARLAEHERGVAHALQRSLLAGELPRDARLRIGTHYRPGVEGLEVGGDWYDAFPVATDRIALVVGDVVGRGVQAASAMGQLRSAIRALAAARLGPGDLLDRLDRFVEHQEVARMATVVYAELALDTGAVRFACAGHPPPVHATPTGASLLWEGRSAPLGAYFGSTRRPEASLVLTPGDRLLLYTDGLVERRDEGLGRRLDALVRAVDAGRDTAPDLLTRSVVGEMLHAVPEDDVCLLVAGYGVGQRFERELAADPEELAPLRADLRTWLAGNRIGPDDRTALVLACGEAAANAIEHGLGARPAGRVLVVGQIVDGAVELLVEDRGGWLDRPPGPDRGRGLHIMRAVMDDVVVDRDAGTKTSVRMRRRCGMPVVVR